MERIALRAEGLRLVKEGREIFFVEEFSLREGEVVALVGPNGSGKTSFLLTLALLEQPAQGKITYNGTAASRENILSLRRRMAVVFQEPLLLNTTVLGNVTVGLKIRGVPPRLARARTEEWLERLGIAHLKKRPATRLSGGEAQRVNLARALVLEPKILFLDEPFAALDYPTRKALLEDLSRILRETKTTTLFVTHDYAEIPPLAHRVVVMRAGRLVREGSPAAVLGRSRAPWEEEEELPGAVPK